MWRRLVRYQIKPPVRCSSTIPLSYAQRTRKYFNDNPYFVVSLGFVGIVLVFGFIVDSITRKKKVTANLFHCLPPRPSHAIVPLHPPLLGGMHVLLTGPEGSGKTTLAYKTCQEFLRQRHWWNRKLPRVFYVDGQSESSFAITLRECLLSYGLTDIDIVPKGKLFHHLPIGEQVQLMVTSLRQKLTSSNSCWLLVVDNVNMDTLSFLEPVGLSLANGRLLIVSHDPIVLPTLKQFIPSLRHVSIDNPTEEQCFTLLNQLSNCDITKDNISVARQLIDMLNHNPMALSCAAVTIATMLSIGHSLDDYVELIQQKEKGAVELYIDQIAKSNSLIRHTLDFLASLNSTYPIPIPVVIEHLKHPEFCVDLKQDSSQPDIPSSPPMEQLSWYKLLLVDPMKLWQKISQIFVPLSDPVDEPLENFSSPLFGYQDNKRTGVQLLHHGNSVHQLIQNLYFKHTVQLMEREALDLAKEQSRKGWFSTWRSFDEGEALSNYRRQLPGIASSAELGKSGVMTNIEYSGGGMDYVHYQQLVAHYHRIVSSVTDVYDCVPNTPDIINKDLFQLTIQAYMMPHLEHLLTVDHMSPCDQARALESLALAHMMVRHTHHTALQLYEKALKKWEWLNGTAHPLTAHVISEMANVYSIMDQPNKSLKLLEKAVDIYDQYKQSMTNKQLLQKAECLSSLAVVCGNYGDKKRARKLIEGSMVLYEKVAIATEGNLSLHYKCQIASLMTDLGHVLIYLGELPLAKKYLDMANASHRNLHDDTHSEVARCLKLQSIMYALQGDRNESKRVRQEAGVIENKLQVIPVM